MDELIESFKQKYNSSDIRIVKSPLRICPLGAHVDHQEGLVTGMTLDSSVNMVYAPSENGYVRVQSLDFPDEDYFHLNHVPAMLPGSWANYMHGAVLALKQDFVIKRGINAIISGKLPIGGLSSSAAVTTAYLIALCDVNNIKISKLDLIKYSHWVETNYIGLKNGILDQSANILSKKNHLLFMDCKTRKYELIEKPASMPDFEVIVVYSGLSKSLIGTDYNNRVEECKVAAWILQELEYGNIYPFAEVTLRNIEPDIYYKHKEKLPSRFQRRAEHFYSENERVKKGVEAWENGDLQAFGKLMFESGESSVYNYECGCPELITIFNILKECKGVYGARFSGAGYRGCCIGLIDPHYKKSIKESIDSKYPVKHPQYKGTYKIHFCKTDDAARIIKN